MTEVSLEEKVRKLEIVQRVGVALGAERDRDTLIEMILVEAKKLCNADGGTLYLRTEDDQLRFAILRSDSLGMSLGGSTKVPIELPNLPLFERATGQPNTKNVATYCALQRRVINIPDAYHASGFDFSGTIAFDRRNNYRSKSFLTLPMVNSEDRVIGVLQLLNARDRDSGAIVPFARGDEQIVSALASQAAIALDNQQLLDQQRELLESFIQAIATAIDAKSPHTGKHCERVPVLTQMLAEAVIAETDGPLADFSLSQAEMYELRIAAWLHDCGKVTTPVHVIDKGVKLEAIVDRMQTVQTRYEVLVRDAQIAHLERVLAGANQVASQAAFEAERARLSDELAFLERSNLGRELLPEHDKARIEAIGERRYEQAGEPMRLLSTDEVENLCISRGTLTPEERVIINRHMVATIKMLEALPFPRHLQRVPEYAAGHHEKMDGSGYPRGIYAGDMSIPARIMAIADVFEALTAQDRPYKRGLSLRESLEIMTKMKADNHLDPDLFDVFIRSGVYRTFGERYLPAHLLEQIDEAALLAVKPRPFQLPSQEEREKRLRAFIAPYDS
jgi:HD-GYP domain-containing protein (c-di-GMP phosphodiesterase class II)